MEAIYIPRLLNLPKRKEEIQIQTAIASLKTLTPVRGSMVVRHGGNFLEIMAKAETIMTLVCDRCLNHYNHRISIDTLELIWLEAENLEFPQEREVAVEELYETLSPDGYFEPEKWLFEQLSLAMPLRQLCGKTCQGTEATSLEESSGVDSRWASLADLKKQLSTNNE